MVASSSSKRRPTPPPSRASAAVDRHLENVTGVSRFEREELIPALAWRRYHLPRYSYCDDLQQYFANNHPLFGLCCRHPLHPIQSKQRLINLFGSIIFGLAVTNIIWLWFELDEERSGDDPLLTITLKNATHTGNELLDSASGEISLTTGMAVLWTVGGGLHALFDNTVWYLTACICCLEANSQNRLMNCRKFGAYSVGIVIVLCTIAATFAVLLRAALDNSDSEVTLEDLKSAGITDDNIDLYAAADSRSTYRFLISYAIEVGLALFVYFPVVGFVLFSGVLGCGVIPVLGGRPLEVRQEEKAEARKQRYNNRSVDPSRTISFGSSYEESSTPRNKV